MCSMFTFSKRKEVRTTDFSDFIRNASAREKKRVYREVLKKATERQNAVLAGKAASAESR